MEISPDHILYEKSFEDEEPARANQKAGKIISIGISTKFTQDIPYYFMQFVFNPGPKEQRVYGHFPQSSINDVLKFGEKDPQTWLESKKSVSLPIYIQGTRKVDIIGVSRNSGEVDITKKPVKKKQK